MRSRHCYDADVGGKLASSESMKAMCRCCAPNLSRHCLNAIPRGFWTPAEQTTQQSWLQHVRRITASGEPVMCYVVYTIGSTVQRSGRCLSYNRLMCYAAAGGTNFRCLDVPHAVAELLEAGIDRVTAT